MTTQERLQAVREELKKQNTILNAYKALEYLESIWGKVTYRNTNMHVNYGNKLDVPLFDCLYINYYARNNSLLNYTHREARYFKDMDDSEAWPIWKKEAYKAAKIYQEFYNSEYNKFNDYEY